MTLRDPSGRARIVTFFVATQLALAYAFGKAHGYRECERLVKTFMDRETERWWSEFLAVMGR